MYKVVLSALTVFMICLTIDGHYLPPRHHWQNSVHHPFVQRMHHDFSGYQYPAFQAYPQSSFQTYPQSAFQAHPSAFQAHPSAFHTGAPVFQGEQSPAARPAFPAPGSLTDESADQGLDIFEGLLRFGAGNKVGGLRSILRAF